MNPITRAEIEALARRTDANPVALIKQLRRDRALSSFLASVEKVQDPATKQALYDLHFLLCQP